MLIFKHECLQGSILSPAHWLFLRTLPSRAVSDSVALTGMLHLLSPRLPPAALLQPHTQVCTLGMWIWKSL